MDPAVRKTSILALLGLLAVCVAILVRGIVGYFKPLPPSAWGPRLDRPKLQAPPPVPSSTPAPPVSVAWIKVDRAFADELLDPGGGALGGVHVVPEQQNGKVIGIRLFGVRPDEPAAIVGLQNGDLIRSVNGIDLKNPETAEEILRQLRTSDRATVRIKRRDDEMELNYEIR